MQLAPQRLKRHLIPDRKIVNVDLPAQHGHDALSRDPVTPVSMDRGGRDTCRDVRWLKLLHDSHIALEVVSSCR